MLQPCRFLIRACAGNNGKQFHTICFFGTGLCMLLCAFPIQLEAQELFGASSIASQVEVVRPSSLAGTSSSGSISGILGLAASLGALGSGAEQQAADVFVFLGNAVEQAADAVSSEDQTGHGHGSGHGP
jgi:hypothetical protein